MIGNRLSRGKIKFKPMPRAPKNLSWLVHVQLVRSIAVGVPRHKHLPLRRLSQHRRGHPAGDGHAMINFQYARASDSSPIVQVASSLAQQIGYRRNYFFLPRTLSRLSPLIASGATRTGLLNGRTWDRTVTAKHATLASFWFQASAPPFAVIEKMTCIGWHRL